MRLKQSTVTIAAGVAFGVIAVALVLSVLSARGAVSDEQRATERAQALERESQNVAKGSALLSDEVREFVVSGGQDDLDAYWEEVNETKSRDKAVAALQRLGVHQDDLALVEEAAANSNTLIETETRAMRLRLEADGVAEADMPGPVAEYQLSEADSRLGADAKRALAGELMLNDDYSAEVTKIMAPITEFQERITAEGQQELEAAQASTGRSMTILIVLAILVSLAIAAVLWVFHSKVGVVIGRYSRELRHRDGEDDAAELEPAGTVELCELADAFNEQSRQNREQLQRNQQLLADLKDVAEEISRTATTVASSSQEMASTSEEAGKAVGEIAQAVSDVAQGAERQVRMIESVKGAVGEASDAASSSAASAQEAASVAEQARSVAREGVEASGNATEAMRAVRDSSQSVSDAMTDLATKSEQIGAIVETITGIAGQTNLLALNAAIEAARAGEQGRGFAVVAEEVRQLAEESQQAAANISQLITEIQSETQKAVSVVEDGVRLTEDGTATVEQTRAAFERIETSVEDMTKRVEQIAASAQQIAADAGKTQEEIAEVAAVAEQSSASTEEVSASTEETSASTQQISASAQELASTAEALEQLVQRLKGDASGHSNGSAPESAEAPVSA